MGRICSMNGGEEKCVKVIGGTARMGDTSRKTKT
jgi:hypothetical protein